MSHAILNAPEATKALQAALRKILKGVARLVLRFGLSYEEFDELAKQAFIEVSEQELALPGRKQTDSRIAVVTGLSRKEVKRLRAVEKDTTEHTTPVQYNRAARVLNGWLRHRDYQDPAGSPLVLPIEGDKPSFTSLVRAHGGDIPVRAVLDELVRIGSVVRQDDGNVRVVHQAYVVAGDIADKLAILGTDVMLLMDTISHNLDSDSEKAYLQLKLSYDNLPQEAIPLLQRISAEDGRILLQQLNRWFADKDRDTNPEAFQGEGRYYAGVGIYFFCRDLDKSSS
ncbi:DUF6502 family protein [Candidatus Albibeggiatoa sp. nov. NOAA]|uniref:DUF6502 family protein n=1 Tax=Candidatus Albibeggiatoa sp. nov. NOAA TaxID=3162724 RepID=UPI0032F3A729|nr:DUF6502 family protein [Thiotrichaceae bacterium]